MKIIITLALAGALALVSTLASAQEAIDVYLASLGRQPTAVGAAREAGTVPSSSIA